MRLAGDGRGRHLKTELVAQIAGDCLVVLERKPPVGKPALEIVRPDELMALRLNVDAGEKRQQVEQAVPRALVEAKPARLAADTGG